MADMNVGNAPPPEQSASLMNYLQTKDETDAMQGVETKHQEATDLKQAKTHMKDSIKSAGADLETKLNTIRNMTPKEVKEFLENNKDTVTQVKDLLNQATKQPGLPTPGDTDPAVGGNAFTTGAAQQFYVVMNIARDMLIDALEKQRQTETKISTTQTIAEGVNVNAQQKAIIAKGEETAQGMRTAAGMSIVGAAASATAGGLLASRGGALTNAAKEDSAKMAQGGKGAEVERVSNTNSVISQAGQAANQFSGAMGDFAKADAEVASANEEAKATGDQAAARMNDKTRDEAQKAVEELAQAVRSALEMTEALSKVKESMKM